MRANKKSKAPTNRTKQPGPVPSESVQAPNFKHGGRAIARRLNHYTTCLPNQPDVVELHCSCAASGNGSTPRAEANGDRRNIGKVNAERRRHVAIVCDQLGPIWIVPFRIDRRVKVTRMTRRLLYLVAKQW